MFNLTINGFTFELGDQVEHDVLESASFQKEGLVQKIFSRTPPDSARFNAQNCTLTCFGEDFSLYPCTHGYLNKDRQWKTSASLFSQKDRFHRFMFHVVEGRYAATSFLDRFRDACTNALGNPTESGRLETRWIKDKTHIVCTLHPDKTNADFLIELNPE